MTALIQGRPSPALNIEPRQPLFLSYRACSLQPSRDILRITLSFFLAPPSSLFVLTIIRAVALRYTSLWRNCKARSRKMRHTEDRKYSAERDGSEIGTGQESRRKEGIEGEATRRRRERGTDEYSVRWMAPRSRRVETLRGATGH